MSDTKTDKIVGQLHKYKTSHPVLSTLWATIILSRQKKLQETIDACQHMLPRLRTISDIDPAALLLLMCASEAAGEY